MATESKTSGSTGAESTAGAKKVLKPWRTLNIGGVHKNTLRKSVDEASSHYAKDIMRLPSFRVSREGKTVDFVVLTMREIGFNGNAASKDFLTSRFCKKWSEENLDRGQEIELCKAEDGPVVHLQYEDQPHGEEVWMAMKPVRLIKNGIQYGYRIVFCFKNSKGRRQFGGRAVAGRAWEPRRLVIFRLSTSKKATAPDMDPDKN